MQHPIPETEMQKASTFTSVHFVGSWISVSSFAQTSDKLSSLLSVPPIFPVSVSTKPLSDKCDHLLFEMVKNSL